MPISRAKRMSWNDSPTPSAKNLFASTKCVASNGKTAEAVADQMMTHDALAAHARDELGMSEATSARPLQAAIASALTFTAGAAAPLAVVPLAPAPMLVPAVAIVALACLAVLGALGARAGGAPPGPSVLRVSFWGALAMGVTAGIGRLFGMAVG